METRELSLSDKTPYRSEIKKQSDEEINGDNIVNDEIKFNGNGCGIINRNESDTTSDRVNRNTIKDPNQTEIQSLVLEDVEQHRGFATCALQEFAKTAQEANAKAVRKDSNNINPLNGDSDSDFLNISGKLDSLSTTSNGGKYKIVETEVASKTLSTTDKQPSYGPLIRGALKNIKPFANHIPNKNSVVVQSSSPSPPSLVVVASNATHVNNSSPDDTLSRSPPLLSPLSTACHCSPTAPSLSSPQLPSLFDMSSSFFSNDNSLHAGDDNEDQRSRSHSSPGRWHIYSKAIDSDREDNEDENDMVKFITNAMGSSACTSVEIDRAEEDKPDSEWMIGTNSQVEMADDLKAPPTTPITATRSGPNFPGGLICLLVTGEKDDTLLKNSIQNALQTANIRIASPAESVSICNKETFDLIWVRVSVPVKEELLSVLASVRCATGKSKRARIIAVADKTLLVDLLLRMFDDVFLEPLPIMTIRHKYSCLIRNKQASSRVAEMNSESRGLKTPESSISLESVKSQSTPSDRGVDFPNLALQSMKHDCLTQQTPSSEAVSGKSPLGLDSPPSPGWCKVEHANKEKQRRVRIKDSCDQLRKLLPYVRGRKTDMASILEMTVDYLQIVNSSLPAEFQTKVIEMLSPDLPLLEKKQKHNETATSTKPKDSMIDMAPLNKPLFLGSKTGQVCSSTSVNTKPNLHKTNLNNSNSSTSHGKDSINISNSTKTSACGSSINNMNRMITRSQISSPFPENSSSAKGELETKTEPCLFIETAQAEELISDSNANTVDLYGSRKLDNFTTIMSKSFQKREMPLNSNLVCSTPKKPHVVLTTKTKDNQGQTIYFSSGNEISKSKSESTLENGHRRSGIKFPNMFTEGDISANRMFSTGHVSRSDIFPYQAPSYLNPAGPPRIPGVPCDGSEIVASVNNMFFDTAYYYYPSPHDSSNGNYFVNNGGSSEYVNPNAVLPVASNSTSRIANFNLGRRYERLSVSGESERYSETAIGSVSLHHHQH